MHSIACLVFDIKLFVSVNYLLATLQCNSFHIPHLFFLSLKHPPTDLIRKMLAS